MQHVATADRVAGHHRNDRFGERPDRSLKIEHVESRYARFIYIPSVASHLLIAPGAEGFRSFSGEDGDADRWIIAYVDKGLLHLDYGLGSEGVSYLRSIDGDLCDPVPGLFVTDILELTCWLPLHLHASVLLFLEWPCPRSGGPRG